MKTALFTLLFTFVFAEILTAGNPPSAEIPVSFRSATCRSDFGSYPVSDGSSAAVVSSFITAQIPNLQNKQTPLLLTFSNASPGGYHYTFCQTYAGVPVFSAEITVNVSRKNIVYSLFDDSYDISKWHVDLTDFSYQNVPAYQAYLKENFSAQATQTAKQVVAYDESAGQATLCYLVNVRDRSGQQRDVLVSRDRIVYQHDLCMHHAAAAPPDSLVSGMVFRPDPLTTAHVLYYAPYMGQDSAYQNFNDSDTYQLNVQRQPVSFYADYNAGTFSLSNQYIQLVQLGTDVTLPATSTTPTFNFTRSQNGFLDVMVYYHLNTIRSYVHSLGFNAADTLLMPDARALTADDDFFSPPDNIFYGTGGVPDCQDADVVVHEYTHFLSWNANHSNGNGSSSERNSVDEGSADYDAASYSASIDTFRWNWVFNWDGHNEYWPGRIVDDRTVYPAQPISGVSGIYRYAEIWSSSLMQIWWEIGKGPADSLFFQTLYGLAGNITLRDAAQQYIKADSLLFNGKYHCTIVWAFNQHGLAADTTCGTHPLDVVALTDQPDWLRYLAYPDGFSVRSVQPDMALTVDLYDVAGRRLATYRDVSTEIRPDIPDGIYIIDVSSASGMHQAFRWALLR